MITSLDHIQFVMPPGSEPEARAYYMGLLGMEEEPKPGAYASRGGCWFRAGAVSVHLGTDAGFVPQDKPHAAFCVVDLDVLVEALTAAGHETEWEGIIPGRKRLYTHDPFGNRIELIQDGDGFSQR